MEPIKEISQLETPCFILDKAELERSISGFDNALSKNFGRHIIGYSVKTNSAPKCLTIAKELGAYAEVVSYDEYELARRCGFAVERIIYNGPMKSKETFIEAVEGGAIVNIETKRELEWLKCLSKEKNHQVGLRLNINISKVSPDDADGDNDNSRFGFAEETGEFERAVEYIEGLDNVQLVGLHIHRTAHSRSVSFYKHSVKYACSVIEKYNLKLDYLDVGGGYFGIFPNKPTYQDYSDAIKEVLGSHRLMNLCVIVEPGNALVASCFAFLSEVIDVKQVEWNLWFVTTDGSRNDIDPFFRKSGYLRDILYQRNGKVVPKQIVAGCTCLEYDRLFEMTDEQQLTVGDKIYYRNVGAYTMCLSPMFIRYIPNIYMKEGDEYVLIREKWSAEDYLTKSNIV